MARIAGTFEFRLAGEGEMDGHSVIIIEAVPREG